MRQLFKSTWAHQVQRALGRRGAPTHALAPAAGAVTVPASAEWDEAFLRVESYLRAHQIESRVLLNQLTSEIIVAARALALENAENAPVTLAMRIAHARIGEWLVRALGDGDWADERFRARGRLAVLMAEVPRHCPERFLSHERMPETVSERMKDARLVPGPELRVIGMPPAPLEFGISEAAEEKWNTFNRSAFLRASTSWLLIAGFLGVAWFATR